MPPPHFLVQTLQQPSRRNRRSGSSVPGREQRRQGFEGGWGIHDGHTQQQEQPNRRGFMAHGPGQTGVTISVVFGGKLGVSDAAEVVTVNGHHMDIKRILPQLSLNKGRPISNIWAVLLRLRLRLLLLVLVLVLDYGPGHHPVSTPKFRPNFRP